MSQLQKEEQELQEKIKEYELESKHLDEQLVLVQESIISIEKEESTFWAEKNVLEHRHNTLSDRMYAKQSSKEQLKKEKSELQESLLQSLFEISTSSDGISMINGMRISRTGPSGQKAYHSDPFGIISKTLSRLAGEK